MTHSSRIDLPYFDWLLERIEAGDSLIESLFGKHVHWGYFEKQDLRTVSHEEFDRAGDAMCFKHLEFVNLKPGAVVIDIGCGFGGTIRCLNEKFSQIRLKGINIDSRQLARARAQVTPKNDNEIEFLQSDAVQLPFRDSSADVILAVECIFHFSSREEFFCEACRVLKPGGRLIFSDIVPVVSKLPFLLLSSVSTASARRQTFGSTGSIYFEFAYNRLAKKSGFKILATRDISKEILPTYNYIEAVTHAKSIEEHFLKSLKWIADVHRRKLARYLVISLEKGNSCGKN